MLSIQKSIEIMEKINSSSKESEKLHLLEEELNNYYEEIKKEIISNLKDNINYYD
jgi:hypothetical protein